MKLLLEDRFAPITSTIGFLKAEPLAVTGAFLEWQSEIQSRRRGRLAMLAVAGSLENALRSLLPLTSVEARLFLFLPTKSGWTAFFDNRHQGTDAVPIVSYLAKSMKCDA